MKVLVVSLLRIGDLMMTVPAASLLKKAHPHATIDLLVNDSCQHGASIFPCFDQVHSFPRLALQQGLLNADQPLFSPHIILDDLVRQLSETNYDWVINLTHNRLSAWLCGSLRAKQTVGLILDDEGRPSFGSPWIRQLNRQADDDAHRNPIHHADLFRLAVEQTVLNKHAEPSPAANSDKSHEVLTPFVQIGEQTERKVAIDSAEWGLMGHSLIALQLSSNDSKKEWGDQNAALLIREISRHCPECRFLLLGAPSESQRLQRVRDELETLGERVTTIPADFATTVAWLSRCRLLITCDTATKHLASAAGIRVLEIALGSADPRRTGPWNTGDIVIASREPCAPCVPSLSCHRDSHVCSQRISPLLVADVARGLIEGDAARVETAAESHRNGVALFRVDQTLGVQSLDPLGEGFTETAIASWIHRLALLVVVENWNAGKERYGLRTRDLGQFLRTRYPNISDTEWLHMLGVFEAQMTHAQGLLKGLRQHVKEMRSSFDDEQRFASVSRGLLAFRKRARHLPALQALVEDISGVIDDRVGSPFSRFRRLAEAVAESERMNLISLKITRSLAHVLNKDFVSEERVE